MAALLLFLVLVALLLGAGAAYNLLLWIGLIALVLWIVGFAYRPSGGRWYYW
jgi:steroid 5-alpha reductase family enzyme